MSKKFYSVKEVAAILGVSKSLIYAGVQQGKIPHRRVMGRKFAAKTKREAIQKGKEFIDALNQKPSDDSKQLTLGNWIIN